MGHGPHRETNPLWAICPLCGADRGEPCTTPDTDATAMNNRQVVFAETGRRVVRTHAARIGEARRRAILDAPATEDVGRWATLEERAGR